MGQPQEMMELLENKQVALLFTVSTAALSHDLGQVSYCKISPVTVLTCRVFMGIK